MTTFREGAEPQPEAQGETPSDRMQHIVFEGRDCIVMAPEDYDQLERELAAAKRGVVGQMREALEAVLAWRTGPEGPDVLFTEGAEMLAKVHAALAAAATQQNAAPVED